MTKQVSEIIKYIDREYLLKGYLLEEYFKNNPEKKPEGEIETSLWRGYFADYEIINNELFVLNLTIIKNGKYTSAIKDVFPDSRKMTWFNGLILIDENEYANNKNLNNETSFKLFEIKNGNISKIKTLNLDELREFKFLQLEMFKLTSEYEILKEVYKDKVIDNHKKYGNKQDRLPNINERFENYLQEFIIEVSKEILTD
ncbi:hypothetical protein FEDK69T_30360 [Flavobacterium enshiense DK69]|uniref:Uncharacterized protein n=1 Tax=Flavobacterium enshiense DK69 TaxID=1107311 RepID=V6S739_9FLAO|nr:hypothetical protein [Flavobacterium enshiense]ESU20185.1 hypothetical protein FEDK69T_30360 [Flavobacterium enshiense DK69]KGO92607.1 hypothetical protein Q767_15540 [Flavobacterium enshiense DK69]